MNVRLNSPTIPLAPRARLGAASLKPRSRGFTLLELSIAMVFVGILVTGITLSISTCLKVWTRSEETSALNQEARASFEVLARDIRGAYLGLDRREGYFITGRDETESYSSSGNVIAEFTTESSSLSRAVLLPEEKWAEMVPELGDPLTDFVAVRYELREITDEGPPGLYRLTWVAPQADWTEVAPVEEDAVARELISSAVTELKLLYYDGEEWLSGWQTAEDSTELPVAVALELTLIDAEENEHGKYR